MIDRIAKITKITIHDQIPIQHNLFLDPVPNQTQGIETIPIINHEIHHTIETETIQTIEIEVIQTIEIRIIQIIDQIHIIDQIITDQMIITKIDHKIIHKIETQVTKIDTEIIPSRHIGIITLNPESKHRYRSSTPKHRRHINQVQTNEETTSDPSGIDDTGSHEILTQINWESSDTESDTDNTISVNMITVENDYEPIIYEQLFTSHIYENQLELLHNYYIGPINNTQTTQEVNEINTEIKPDKKDETQFSNTKHFIKIYKKNNREKKFGQFHFS